MYATVADLRDEGITELQAPDERLLALIEEATMMIDRATGCFFEPRNMTIRINGRGTPSIKPPVPPILLDEISLNNSDFSPNLSDIIIVGAPIQPGFSSPMMTLIHGQIFPRGDHNIEVKGLFGYTEEDGTLTGRTPLEIRRACMLIVLRWIPRLGDSDASEDARNRWRIIEEKTRDQSYKLASISSAAQLTGDPDIDAILVRYSRPSGLGAV